MQSTENHTIDQADQVAACTPSPKQCPFCNGLAVFTTCYEPVRYGVRCTACQVIFLPVLESEAEAVALWNRRCGTVSAAGGRASAGKCSRRKLRAARRNLKKARQVLQLNRLRRSEEAAYAQLRPYLDQELALAEEQAAKSRAELLALEPAIRRDPQLSEMLDWLKSRWAQAEGGAQHLTDSRQCPPADSVLGTKHDELDHY